MSETRRAFPRVLEYHEVAKFGDSVTSKGFPEADADVRDAPLWADYGNDTGSDSDWGSAIHPPIDGLAEPTDQSGSHSEPTEGNNPDRQSRPTIAAGATD
jgi:hypothetical protein